MARNKGVASLGFNFQVEAAAPLDTRTVVQNLADLTSESTWLKDGNLYIYEGMEVYVEETKNKYLLTDPANYNNIASWKVSGSGSGGGTSESEHVELTQAQYDALTTEEKNNGKVYFVNETTGSTTKGKIFKNGIMYNDLGTVTGNYTAGQGVRITNDVIDTPLLDNDYLKETVQVPGLVPGTEDQIIPIKQDYYLCYPGTNDTMSSSSWSDYFTAEALTRDQAILYIKTTEDDNWHLVTGYTNFSAPINNNLHLPIYDLRPERDSSDDGPLFNSGGNYTQVNNYQESKRIRITGVKRILTVQVPGMVDTPVHVRQLSGVAKEDYSDEWFSDLTEQQIIEIFDNVYGEGAEINEQFEEGVSIPFGTWKENGVVYDLCRKVLIYNGTLPTNGVIEFPFGETDVSFIIGLSGTALASDGSYVISAPAQDNSLGYVPQSGNIRFSTLANYSNYTKLRVVVEYARIRG